MNKKMICSIVSAAVLFGTCPMTVLADDDLKTLKTPLDFRNVKVDMEDSDMGWKWKANSQKLILEDFRVHVPSSNMEKQSVIFLPDDCKVELEGENNHIKVDSYHCDIFSCEGDMIISSDGKLMVETVSLGTDIFFSEGGSVTVKDEVEITADPCKGRVAYIKHAKGNDPVFSINGDAKITLHEDDIDDDSIFVTHKSSVTPSSNWISFAEIVDDWDDEYIHLISENSKKPAEPVKPIDPPAEEPSTDKPVKQSEYQIVIGNSAIKKDGTVTYISDANPYLSHGYTMLPLRALLTVTGADVDIALDAVTKTITVTEKSDSQYANKVTIVIGEKQMKHGAESIDLYTPAELDKTRAFVSLRDWMNILSALDMPASDLNWDAKTKTVTFMK